MPVLGLDIGYSNVKVAVGDNEKTLKCTLFPATAAPLAQLIEAGLGADTAIRGVPVGNLEYVVGVTPERLAHYHRALHADYTATNAYRALFYGALLAYGKRNVDVVVTGLPSGQFRDATLRKRLGTLMSGAHTLGKERTVTVNEVKVVPQPIGAYLDFVSSEDADVDDARVLVIDVGYYSVDWVLVKENRLQGEGLGSSQLASAALLDKAVQAIAKDYGKILPDTLEARWRQGKTQVRLYDKQVELLPYLTSAAKEVAGAVIQGILPSLRQREEAIDVILLAGGGAGPYAQPIKEAFPRSQLVLRPEAVFANARGFWRYGRGD